MKKCSLTHISIVTLGPQKKLASGAFPGLSGHLRCQRAPSPPPQCFGETPPNIDLAVARSAKVGLGRKFNVKLPGIKRDPYLLFPLNFLALLFHNELLTDHAEPVAYD